MANLHGHAGRPLHLHAGDVAHLLLLLLLQSLLLLHDRARARLVPDAAAHRAALRLVLPARRALLRCAHREGRADARHAWAARRLRPRDHLLGALQLGDRVVQLLSQVEQVLVRVRVRVRLGLGWG